LEIKFDLYHPLDVPATVPVVIYFHAGWLITGDRNSVLPIWLMKRVEAAGFAFISADYRLLPLGGVTGHDILQDIKDLFAFIAATDYEHPAKGTRYRIDEKAILATGQSAGSLCAFLSNHATPKPKAIFSLYGMGGDFFVR
ncbi:Alpha/Beta hydrolase protein, partial [Mucidula mucida]